MYGGYMMQSSLSSSNQELTVGFVKIKYVCYIA